MFKPIILLTLLCFAPGLSQAASTLEALQSAWQQRPDSLETALPLAQAYVELAHTSGKDSYFAQARSLLQPWWQQTEVPVGLRLLRAQLLFQQQHFPAALADLRSLPAEDLSICSYAKSYCYKRTFCAYRANTNSHGVCALNWGGAATAACGPAGAVFKQRFRANRTARTGLFFT